VAKDQIICAWFSANGERLGTYHGHQGAIWTVDVDPNTNFIASGAADNTIRLWEVKTGKLLKTWDFGSAIKRVEFSPDGMQLLGVTEKRVGHLSTIVVYDINPDPEAEQSNEQSLRIVCDDAKATVAGFSFDGRYIVSGHEDGTVNQYDAKVSMPFLVIYFSIGFAKSYLYRPAKWKTAQPFTTIQSPIFNGPQTVHTLSLPPRTKQPSSLPSFPTASQS
jgi:WD40 repeat protein